LAYIAQILRPRETPGELAVTPVACEPRARTTASEGPMKPSALIRACSAAILSLASACGAEPGEHEIKLGSAQAAALASGVIVNGIQWADAAGTPIQPMAAASSRTARSITGSARAGMRTSRSRR